MKYISTPFSNNEIEDLRIGDVVSISGFIFCGRDAVLPLIVKEIEMGKWPSRHIDLEGSVVFHTAVSPAGVGPTSSNKLEIESSFAPLSKAGVKMHLGKGEISDATVEALREHNAVFAIIPPVTSLLESRTFEREIVAFPELGMEAFYRIRIDNYQAIIAAANGESIYGKHNGK